MCRAPRRSQAEAGAPPPDNNNVGQLIFASESGGLEFDPVAQGLHVHAHSQIITRAMARRFLPSEWRVEFYWRLAVGRISNGLVILNNMLGENESSEGSETDNYLSDNDAPSETRSGLRFR